MDLYLHHYPASLFSEKIRTMLGYFGLAWKSVVISSVMPRPLLMPLTGGYRRTPCMQIGANVYCDTAVITRGLVRHTGDKTLFEPGFPAHRTAEWADSQLFRVVVALTFQPAALATMFERFPPEEAAAFAKDRASLTDGAPLQTFSVTAAQASLDVYLRELEVSLDLTSPFLFGASPSIADFSVYHCLWLLGNNAYNAPLLAPFANVCAWMNRIAAFGHGDVTDSTGEEALAHANASTPVLPELTPVLPEGIAVGDRVTVTPTDYGRIPVEGALAAIGTNEIVLARETPETGSLLTHFPSVGFELSRV